MYKHKLNAFLIHFGLSALLVTLILASAIFFFFPLTFIKVTDFKEVASIIVAVDLILGPLLTFIVFQKNKKSLKFDLSIIASIQVAALLYGVYALYQIHPVYITFNVDRFTLVNAKDAQPNKAIHDEYKVSKFSSAKLAYAKMPTDNKQKNEITLAAALGGRDLDQRVEYYAPYKSGINEIVLKGLDPKKIFSTKNHTEPFNHYKKNANLYAFLPITSDNKDAIIIIDKKTADAIAMIDINPWEL